MIILFWLILLISQQALTTIHIPTGLSHDDRLQALEILVLPTTAHLNTSSYPLGGYYGLEAGLSYETINTSSLSSLGNQSEKQSSISYPLFTVGKGLFYDIDVFAHFAPVSGSSRISQFGGLIRWKFFEFKTIPLHFSVIGHSSSTDFQSQIVSRSTGYAALAGIYFRGFSTYYGLGKTNANGTFTGDEDGTNNNGLTIESSTVKERIEKSYQFAGASFLYNFIFISAEISFWQKPSTSLKLGMRF